MYKLNKTNKTATSFFYLGLCILSWGLIPVVTKKILVELNSLQMLFYSTIFSCIVMFGIVLSAPEDITEKIATIEGCLWLCKLVLNNLLRR